MKDRVATCLATWFGAGFSPRAPGTVGTLAAAPLFWLLKLAPPIVTPLATLAVCGVGLWASQRVCDRLNAEDPQIIVIDEAAGVLLAMWIGGGANIWLDLLAIALFRLFDIFKPWPIAPLERLKPAGLGVMMDDIAAGILAGLIVRLI